VHGFDVIFTGNPHIYIIYIYMEVSLGNHLSMGEFQLPHLMWAFKKFRMDSSQDPARGSWMYFK
jgi:hypothetical protein